MGRMITVNTQARPNVRVVLARDDAGEPTAWIEFRPADTPGQALGQQAALEMLAAGEEGPVASVAFTVALARWGLVDWAGIGDQAGQPLAATRENLELLLTQNAAVYAAVDREYAVPALGLVHEKNASAPSPDGGSPGSTPTSRTARALRSAGATTARTAKAGAAKTARSKSSSR